MKINLVYRKLDKTYTGADGKEYVSKQLYLQLENGLLIAVRPSFKEDSKLLYSIADKYEE